MKKSIVIKSIAIIGLILGLNSCERKKQNAFDDSDKEVIAQLTMEAFKSFNETNDYKVFVDNFYSENATVLMTNTEPIQGRDAITKTYTTTFGSLGKIKYDLTIDEINGTGDLAYMQGKYYFEILSNGVKDNGKFIAIWKKQADGKWKVIRDISNTSVPAQPI